MRDTEPAVLARWHSLIAALDGATRVRMAAEMFDTGRALAEAAVRAEGGVLDDAELRARVFERLYPDLDEATRHAVVARIRCRETGIWLP